jgi:hypothetical protein
MRHLQHVVLGFCVVAAACAGEAPTAPTVASSATSGAAVTEAQGGSELPFRGTFQATETTATVNDPMNHLVGTGNATHLGRFTLTSDFTVDVATATAVGTAVWTAANGDQLFTTVTGEAVVTFPNAAIVETHVITGGTGRFAGASGKTPLRVERSLNLVTNVSSASITGTISLSH